MTQLLPTGLGAGRNLLVLLFDAEDSAVESLRDAIADEPVAPERIHVVVPAHVGPLAWLASADDAARRSAEVSLLATEWSLAEDAAVEGDAGEVDPVQAVEDALRGFPADEIVVVGAADDELASALAQFGLPVVFLATKPGIHRSAVVRAARRLAGGHDPSTPFVLFFGVNAAFFLVAVLLSLLVLLILWIVGAF